MADPVAVNVTFLPVMGCPAAERSVNVALTVPLVPVGAWVTLPARV